MELHSVVVLLFIFNIVPNTHGGGGVGIAFSGAGGRIGQHIALAESLLLGSYPSGGGRPLRPDFLSGASSGAISSVLVNAVIESQETSKKNWTWDYVKEILFNIQAGNIYDNSAEGIIKIPINMVEGYVLDNSPMINFLGSRFSEAGYNTLGDLYIPTAFSLMNQSSGETVRLWSDDPRYSGLSLLEVVIASTSIPVVFPPRTISGLGNTLWIDGGTGIDTLPVYALLNRPEVKSFYIVCYSSATTSGGSTVPPVLDHLALLKNALAVFDDLRVDLFLAGLEETATQKVKPAYSFIPKLNQTFSVLDFDDEKLEYTLASLWAILNNPSLLN